jgi:hypothetical protein
MWINSRKIRAFRWSIKWQNHLLAWRRKGDDDSSRVGTDLLPPAPLPSNAWTPLFLSTCCLLLPLPTSFVIPKPSTNFPLLRFSWWWLAMVVGPAQLSFLFSNLPFYYYYY